MKQAVKSASKWLIEHTTRNPVPYKLFKSILNNQIEWAKNNRGVTISFSELSEAVRAELLKAGIYTVSENGISNKPAKIQDKNTISMFEEDENTPGEISPLILSLNHDSPKFTALFKWFLDVFSSAQSNGYTELHFSVKAH